MVLLDTNVLMMPVQCKVDLFEGLGSLLGAYEPVVLKGVLEELEGLARGRGRDAAAARLGLSLAARCTAVPAEAGEKPVDEQLIAYAEKHSCPVATNDRGLRDALLSRGISVISLQNNKKLGIFRR
jgi:rRNA-processing protein FCF1